MPRKYQIEARFSLTTEIECEVSRYGWNDTSVSDFNDNSYFRSSSVEADGGELTFVVEAEDEGGAEEAANEVIYEGQEVEDSNGLTWLVERLDITVELVEVPMDLTRAKELIAAFIASFEGMDEDLKEAFTFILDNCTGTPFSA